MKRLVVGVLVLAMPGLVGCYDFSGNLRARRDIMARKVQDLKRAVATKADKFNQRDMLRSQLNQLESEIEQIKTMIAAEKGGKR